MIRILIADDHAIVREGLKQLFALCADIRVAGEAMNNVQVGEALRRGGVDLLLLDMSMPGISGVDLIRRVRLQDAHLPVLVLSMRNELQIVRRALQAGASGYLTKDSDPTVLMEAVRKVAAGGRFIDPALTEQLVFGPQGGEQGAPHTRLSNREFDILRLLAEGKSVNDIAALLSISNKTVSTHKARLMQKMDCHNSSALVRYAVEHGLID